MSSNDIGETQRLIKFIEKIPFSDEEKKAWLEILHGDGISTELIEEIHQKFLKIDPEKLGGDWSRARDNMEITSILKQWRLSLSSRNFRRSR